MKHFQTSKKGPQSSNILISRSLTFFLEKVVLLGVKKFNGLQENLKNITTPINPGRYSADYFSTPKKKFNLF